MIVLAGSKNSSFPVIYDYILHVTVISFKHPHQLFHGGNREAQIRGDGAVKVYFNKQMLRVEEHKM